MPTNGAPASYPSIYWGCHYANCTPNFNPIQANTAAFGGISTSVAMSYPSTGQWDAAYDATVTQTGTSVRATSLSYNGSIAPNATTTFGLQADGTAGAPSLTCTAT